jgi:Uma2 family endonuclease
MATTVVTADGKLSIPNWVVDHKSFLRWIRSGAVSEDVRVGYVRDAVWVYSMPERLFAHTKIKTLVSGVLDRLVRKNHLGVYFGDGALFTSETEHFSCVPDGIFVSRATIDAGRVWLSGSKRSAEETELVGCPDLTIEVVSRSSVWKDTDWYMTWYWNAGIEEYWLIDARKASIDFTIHRRDAKGYHPVRKVGGWTKSPVLGYSFRFVTGEKIMGKQDYDFEYR